MVYAIFVTLGFFSLLMIVVEIFFGYPVSESIAKVICQESYMQPVLGIVGDCSCGFNADMYGIVFLLFILVVSVILAFSFRNS